MVLSAEDFFADASNTIQTWRELQSLLEKENKLAEYCSMENAFDPTAIQWNNLHSAWPTTFNQSRMENPPFWRAEIFLTDVAARQNFFLHDNRFRNPVTHSSKLPTPCMWRPSTNSDLPILFDDGDAPSRGGPQHLSRFWNWVVEAGMWRPATNSRGGKITGSDIWRPVTISTSEQQSSSSKFMFKFSNPL